MDTKPTTTADAHGISREVPPELWLSVFVAALDEAIAIERGRRAATATSEDECHRILFDTTVTATEGETIMEPKITIDTNSTPRANGYGVRTHYAGPREENYDYDVYILSRRDGTPYLVLVGEADVCAWRAWRGYSADMLLPDERQGHFRLALDTPHEVLVEAAIRRFLEDERNTKAA